MNSDSRAAWLVTALVLCASACADLERGGSAPDATAGPADASLVPADVAGSDAATAALSFAHDVQPVLAGACARCHSDGGEASRSALVLGSDPAANLAQVAKLINRDDPAGSRLLQKATGTGHQGGAVLRVGTPEYQTILVWITQGSLP